MRLFFHKGFLTIAMLFVGITYTGAYFSDSVSVSGNTFSTGIWNPGRVVINEVLYDPSGTEPNDEWVELYNAGGMSVDLSGYVLADNTGSLTLTSLILGPGQYAVYARDGASFTAKYGFAPNFSGSSIALGNSGDYITLRDSSSVLLDAVAWNTASFAGVIPHYDVAQDHVLARYPDGVDTDDCSIDFIDSINQTPGGPNV